MRLHKAPESLHVLEKDRKRKEMNEYENICVSRLKYTNESANIKQINKMTNDHLKGILRQFE
jgi:hypothetical protein